MTPFQKFRRTEMIRIAAIALSLLALLPAKFAFAQAADTPFQTTVVTNDLTRGDTLVALSNTGGSATTITNGALCMNVYATTGNGAAPPPLAACCSCKMQPNGFASLSVNTDILAGVSPRPKNVTIKLMSSTGSAGLCNAGSVGTGANVLATGMVAWQNAPQSAQLGAPGTPITPFTPSTLSAAELTRLDSACAALTPGRTCSAVCAP
jgi:hypothetical protein